MKSSRKLDKIKGYHLSIQGKWKGNLFREKWFIKVQGVRAREGSPYKTCWVPPPPPLGLCQVFGNHVEFTIIKGEPILTVENSYEFFFSFQTTLSKGLGWMLFRDSRDSRFVPWHFPDRFFYVFQYGDEKTEPNGRARVEKEAGVPFSEQKSIFIITGYLMTEMYFLSPRV